MFIFFGLRKFFLSIFCYFSWEGGGNSYKPSQDLWEVTLLRRTRSGQWLARSFSTDKETDRQANILILYYKDRLIILTYFQGVRSGGPVGQDVHNKSQLDNIVGTLWQARQESSGSSVGNQVSLQVGGDKGSSLKCLIKNDVTQYL